MNDHSQTPVIDFDRDASEIM